MVAALASSRVGQKQFMPTALLAQHLPAGLGSMCNVPRLSDMVAETEAARLEEYIITIRRHGTATPAHVCLVGAPSPQLEAWGALGAGVVDGRAIGLIAESPVNALQFLKEPPQRFNIRYCRIVAALRAVGAAGAGSPDWSRQGATPHISSQPRQHPQATAYLLAYTRR